MPIADTPAPLLGPGGPPSPGQVRAARALLGWSLVEAARAAGVSVSAVSRQERGAGAAPDDAAAIASAYRLAGVGFERGGLSLAEPPRARGAGVASGPGAV